MTAPPRPKGPPPPPPMATARQAASGMKQDATAVGQSARQEFSGFKQGVGSEVSGLRSGASDLQAKAKAKAKAKAAEASALKQKYKEKAKAKASQMATSARDTAREVGGQAMSGAKQAGLEILKHVAKAGIDTASDLAKMGTDTLRETIKSGTEAARLEAQKAMMEAKRGIRQGGREAQRGLSFEEEEVEVRTTSRRSRGGRRRGSVAQQVSISATDIQNIEANLDEAIAHLNNQEVSDDDIDNALQISQDIQAQLKQLKSSSSRGGIAVAWAKIENINNLLGDVISRLNDENVSDDDLDEASYTLEDIKVELQGISQSQAPSGRTRRPRA